MAAYEVGKKVFNARFLTNKQEIAFYEWLRERRNEAGVQSATEAPPVG